MADIVRLNGAILGFRKPTARATAKAQIRIVSEHQINELIIKYGEKLI